MRFEIASIIEESDYFFVFLTETYLEDPDCIEQILYAKLLNKPFIILKQIGYNLELPDIFNGVNIIGELEEDLLNIESNQIVAIIDKYIKQYKKKIKKRR